MGKFLKKFKSSAKDFDKDANKYIQKRQKYNGDYNKQKIKPQNQGGSNDLSGSNEEFNDFNNEDDDYGGSNDFDEELNIQPAQKPESFHHFILENKYQDLEGSIRGLKTVWDKENQKYTYKRKDLHCFTDEEAEDILRTVQVHLSTDIKLANWNKETFGSMMVALYDQMELLFERIAEYFYGRYNTFNKNGSIKKVNYELQGKMKLQNLKILQELMFRIQANYSMGIGGQENKATHGSVQGQESLQGGERNMPRSRGYV